MDPNPTPSRPDYIAVHDQAAAELRPKAQVVASYWKALRESGVPEYEATELVRDFQWWMLTGIGKGDDDAGSEDEDSTTGD